MTDLSLLLRSRCGFGPVLPMRWSLNFTAFSGCHDLIKKFGPKELDSILWKQEYYGNKNVIVHYLEHI